MNDVVLKWISQQARERDFPEPIVEFGALQVLGQEGYADIRRFFPGKEYEGCDITPGPGVDLIENLEMSHFAPGEIGTVICLETLEHVKHPWIAVAEVFRILKAGGLLLVSVPFRLPIHCFPDDYWRITASGLEELLTSAGFVEIEVSDSGEDVMFDTTWDKSEETMQTFHFPFIVFGVARKASDQDKKWVQSMGKRGLFGRDISLQREFESEKEKVSHMRDPTPIVVTVFHREEDTRKMFEQLARVTNNYSLIIVNNGFDDPDFLRSLNPLHYIENEENTGAIRPINQGLEVAEGEYIAVLHSDLLIYDEGWLDHIVDFLDRRPDVGLVGFAGRHTINEDGAYDNETTIVNHRGVYPISWKPTWRFTEVATIDGIGWVMRNMGLRLDEGLGLMHCYDLDLSLQYIEAGYRVYVAGVDLLHMASDIARSARSSEEYLCMIGGNDDAYQVEVIGRFRQKWQHMLPLVRGFRDEEYGYARVEELSEQVAELGKRLKEMEEEDKKKDAEMESAFKYVAALEADNKAKAAELEKAGQYARKLENALQAKTPEQIRQLPPESVASDLRSSNRTENSGSVITPDSSLVEKFRFYMRNEGFTATIRKTVEFAGRKLGRQ